MMSGVSQGFKANPGLELANAFGEKHLLFQDHADAVFEAYSHCELFSFSPSKLYLTAKSSEAEYALLL